MEYKRPIVNPCCGAAMDGALCIHDTTAQPRPKDFSICFECGAWLRYVDADMNSRLITAEDWLDITDEQRAMMHKATAFIRWLRRHQTDRRKPTREALDMFRRRD